MALRGVKVTEEVWVTCLTHALSTETEEIMGLLLGDIQDTGDGWQTALVWGASPQTRSDRRKDRVETNPEQLAAASAQAERMTAATGRTTRVIGWYHSHPHITVMPSHVDVRTQGMYQMLDPGFVGLIFSCFSEDATKVGRIQAIAFQSQDGKSHTQIPLSGALGIRPLAAAMPAGEPSGRVIPSFRRPEEAELDRNQLAKGGGDQQGGSAALEDLFAVAVREPPKSGAGSGFYAEALQQEELPGMEEALHLSTLDISAAEFVRKEVPLEVVPGHSLAQGDFPLRPLVDLQRILFAEEQAAYKQAMKQYLNGRGEIHTLAAIHHSSTYQASLAKLLEYCLCPVSTSLWDRLEQNKLNLAELQDEAVSLQLQAMSSTRRSPPQWKSPKETSTTGQISS